MEQKNSKYLVQTHSQTKDSGIKIPEVHGAKKGINPNLRPEWLVRKFQKSPGKPRIEQDIKDHQVRDQLGSGTREILENHKLTKA